MEFDPTSLLNSLDRVIRIDDLKGDFATKYSLPPCDYDGVIDYPDIIEQQARVGYKISRHLGVPFNWPREVYFANLPEGVYGMADRKKRHIIYSEALKQDTRLRKIASGHEIVHFHEEGLDEFLRMYSIYIILDENRIYLINIPTGRILAEGGTEVLLTKIDEPRGGYEREFQLMQETDELTPVKSLYPMAQSYGSDFVWQKLYNSGVMELIDRYVLEVLKKRDLKNPVIMGRKDISVDIFN